MNIHSKRDESRLQSHINLRQVCNQKNFSVQSTWISGSRVSNCRLVFLQQLLVKSYFLQFPRSSFLCHFWVTNLGLSSYLYSFDNGVGPTAEQATQYISYLHTHLNCVLLNTVAPFSPDALGEEDSSLGFVFKSLSSRGSLSCHSSRIPRAVCCLSNKFSRSYQSTPSDVGLLTGQKNTLPLEMRGDIPRSHSGMPESCF